MGMAFDLSEEMVRAYDTLDADAAELQNQRDIEKWAQDGLITAEKRDEFIEFNKHLHTVYLGDEAQGTASQLTSPSY